MMARSRASARQAGTKWETAICDYLRTQGWPHAERRAKTGALDKGDITGLPGVVIEAKNTAAFTLSTFVKEAKQEAVNADATAWAAWIKRPGKSSPADAYVLMDGEAFARLLREAGY